VCVNAILHKQLNVLNYSCSPPVMLSFRPVKLVYLQQFMTRQSNNLLYERGYVGLLAWVQYFHVYYVHAIYTGSISPEVAVIKIVQYSTDSSLTPCLTLELRLTSVKLYILLKQNKR